MITVPADHLRSCIKVVSPTIPTKPTSESLACLRVRWIDGSVIFSSHNLSAGSSLKLGECDEPKYAHDLIVMFDAIKGFAETLDKNDPDVEISWTDKTLFIACGDAAAEFPLSDIDSYPKMDATASESLDPMPVELLKSTLKFLLGIPETDVNTSMFYDLDRGIMGTMDNCEVRFVRGFQQAAGRICIGNANSRILKAFLSQCDDADELIPEYSESHFNLRSAATNRSVSVRLVDPTLVRKIPDKFLSYRPENQATTSRAGLSKLAKQALLVSGSESKCILFSMSGGSLDIRTSKESAKTFNGRLPVNEGFSGEFVTFLNSERLFYAANSMGDVEVSVASNGGDEHFLLNCGTQTSILASMSN